MDEKVQVHYCVDHMGKEMLVMGREPSSSDQNAGNKLSPSATAKSDNSTPAPTMPAPYRGSNKIMMMEWEKGYMEACVDALQITPGSHVLEIGFGLGIGDR